MPHRRLVKIGETPALPTIAQFLTEMASRQHDEIIRLKQEAAQGRLPDPSVAEEDHDELTPDPWQLHPVRIKKAPTARRKTPKKAAPKKAASKATSKSAKKSSKRTAAKSKNQRRPRKSASKRR